MEAVLGLIAKLGFTSFSYYGAKFYYYKVLNDDYTTAGQIDLSYEKIDEAVMKNDLKKTFLICGASKTNINIGKSIQIFNVKQLFSLRRFNKDIILSQKKDKIDSNINSIDNDKEEDYTKVTIKTKNRIVKIYDASNTKQIELKKFSDISRESITLKLSYVLKKLNILISKQLEKVLSKSEDENCGNQNKLSESMFLVDKAINEDQVVLVLGKIEFKNKEIIVNPEAVICSGMVEFEEIIEFLKNKSSERMYQIVMILFAITILDFILKMKRVYTDKTSKSKNEVDSKINKNI